MHPAIIVFAPYVIISIIIYYLCVYFSPDDPASWSFTLAFLWPIWIPLVIIFGPFLYLNDKIREKGYKRKAKKETNNA